MKTRIRIRKFNSGKIEYVCEVDCFDDLSKKMWCGFFGWWILIPILYFSDKRWEVIARKLPMGLNIEGEMSSHKTYGRFDTIERAKEFIDGYIKEMEGKKLQEHNNKVNDETFLKYP